MDKKSRIVILCEAYHSIDYPLYMLENEWVDMPVTIFITSYKDLYYLFKVINEKIYDNNLDLVYYPLYKRRWTKTKGIRRLLYILPDILGERRYLKQFYNQHFARLKNATIIFSTPGYTGVKIYVIRKLSKRNRLIYRDTAGLYYMSRYSPQSLRDIALLLIYKMIYGRDVQHGHIPFNPLSKGFPLMSDSFMRNSVDSVIDWSNRTEVMEDFNWEKFSVFDPGDHQVMYFHQDIVGDYVPDRDMFSRELNSVFDVVRRYYSEEKIARKYHPGQELNKDVIGIGEELPVYIPSELLYNEKVQIYLGIFTNAIVNVRGGQAISLINLISFKSDDVKERLKERLIRLSHSEILFPSSLEELEGMIIEISGRKR